MKVILTFLSDKFNEYNSWLGYIMKEALDKKLNSVILKASFYYIPCVKMPY